MGIKIKKLLAGAVFALGAWMCVATVQAQSNQVIYDGITYNISTYEGTYNNAPMGTQFWFGSGTMASNIAGQVGNYFDFPNPNPDLGPGALGPLFAYGTYGSSIQVAAVPDYAMTTAEVYYQPIGESAIWAVYAAAAPEIDGSLAPKIGLLLGCSYLMFGRKKQNSEPMMTA